MRKVENAVQESHDYVSCQEQTQNTKTIKKAKRCQSRISWQQVIQEY
jgi:DNA-binding IscR family transcriptional regulator